MEFGKKDIKWGERKEWEQQDKEAEVANREN